MKKLFETKDMISRARDVASIPTLRIPEERRGVWCGRASAGPQLTSRQEAQLIQTKQHPPQDLPQSIQNFVFIRQGSYL